MKTIKEIVKITKRGLPYGNFNWLICLTVGGGILYAITKEIYWLIFGISFGVVFNKDHFLGKSKKEEQTEE